jgi:hypothetical protein
MDPEKLTPSGNLTALKADSQDDVTIKEPCFMLPENERPDYRISTTDQPIGIQRKRTKGWKMPPNTISVTRPGEWGNPHAVTYQGVDKGKYAQQAVDRFERDLVNGTILDKHGKPLINRIGELRGKNLACFCPIGQPCHRDVLLKLANTAIASVGGAA